MRLTVTPARLDSVLDVARRACGRAAAHTYLPYILLEAGTDGTVAATGTDLTTRARHAAEALVSEPGAVCLPPSALADFLGAVPSDLPVDIAVDAGHKAVLTCGRSLARVAGMDPEGFPAATVTGEPAWACAVPPDLLRSLVNSVAYAAARDAVRPALSGIHVVAAGGRLTMTAADGVKLARRCVGVPDLDGGEIIVPAEALVQVAAALDGAEGTCTLAVDAGGRRLSVGSSAGTWTITLLEGRYPEVSRMFAQEPRAAYTVARSEFLRACGLVSGVLVAIEGMDGRSAGRLSKAVLEPVDDGLSIRAGDVGADHMAQTVIDVQTDGEPYPVAVNSGALRAAAEALAGPLLVELYGPGQNVSLREAGNPDRLAHCHYIQPLAVGSTAVRAA